MISDKVRPHDLERKANLYVRQSSAHQVLHNRESSALHDFELRHQKARRPFRSVAKTGKCSVRVMSARQKRP